MPPQWRQRDTSVSDLCKELGIERVTLYRYVGPKGELRDYGKRVLGLDSPPPANDPTVEMVATRTR
jgi:hypothetical protein